MRAFILPSRSALSLSYCAMTNGSPHAFLLQGGDGELVVRSLVNPEAGRRL